jgi:drug/metabolite transporter (DMT)-like permease
MELVNLKSKKSFGISLSLVEVTSTILIASLVKLIAAELSVFLILFFRYLFCIPLLFLTSFYQRKKDTFKIISKSGLFVRTAAGLFSFGFLFAALKYIDLSLMTTLLNTIPLFVTLLAPILINERVGNFKIIMALIGFMGVFLIINPSYELLKFNNFGIIYGILCPLCASIMLISLRKLGNTDHPTTTALWYNIIGAVVFYLICVIIDVDFKIIENSYFILILIGVLSSLQQICLSYSHKLLPVSLLAPLRYISVPLGILVGVIYFEEKMQPLFYLGAFIIGLTCVLIVAKKDIQIKSQ